MTGRGCATRLTARGGCGAGARYKVYSIGNSEPVQLLEFVDILQRVLVGEGILPEVYDFGAHRELVPMQPGDVVETYVDCSEFERDFGYKPAARFEDGMRAFAKWYRECYDVGPIVHRGNPGSYPLSTHCA